MQFPWRRNSAAEDRLETWVRQRYEEYVLSGNTIPEGPCPDEAFLGKLARRSRSISLSDPRIDHAASCPKCMARLLELRKPSRPRRPWIVLSAAAAVAILLLVWAFLPSLSTARHETGSVTASATVNLWNAAPVRGSQPAPLQSVSLPAKQVKVTILLPRFSPPGRYLIAVTRDRAGRQVIATGAARSSQHGEYQEVSVQLDLRNTSEGKYFLSTTHEQDESSYYYPLHIR